MDNFDQFPLQKLPQSKKGKAWGEACVDYIIGSSGSLAGNNSYLAYEEMQSLYDLYNGLYDEKDLKYVSNPYKQDDGFPAKMTNMNVIKSKVDLLLGEETKRFDNIFVTRTSDIAASEMQDEAKQRVMGYIMASIMAKLGPEEQQQFQQGLESGEIMTPEQIQNWLTKDYKDMVEVTAYHIIKYLRLKLNLAHEFFKGWKDTLIVGREIYYVGLRNGEPFCKRINPKQFTYDEEGDHEFIHEASWCCYKEVMSASTLYDHYWDKLSEKQLNEILEITEDGARALDPELRKTGLDYNHIKMKTINSFTQNPFDSVSSIPVWHCCWKSYQKIGFVTILNEETGETEEFEVDETYKPTGDELDIYWDWIIVIYEGYRAAQDVYFGIGPMEYQHISSITPNAQKLPYTGLVLDRSLVSLLKPLQYMFIILWYRVELAMSRDKGKVPVIDVTQIPKSMGIDVNKWMHYMSAMGVAFINPYEEGWDIPGREGGKASLFNQFQAWDLTMANTIDQYINLMDKIEQMISDISGVTKQREGAISSNELVGNVQHSIVQSAHITEPLFHGHSEVKKHVLTMLLDTAKHAWRDNRETLHYILDDATRTYLTLSPEFFTEDLDVFLTDSSKEQENVEALKSLTQAAMQNGASLLDIAEVMVLDSATMIRHKLEEIEQKRMEQQQAAQDMEAQRQQELIAMQNEIKEQELAMQERKLDIEQYKIDKDAETRIVVAEIQAYRGTQDMDQNANGIPDPMEIADQALARHKTDSETNLKRMEIRNEEREIEAKKNIEDKKLKLEEKRMGHETKLQQQKDDAAMEREKLKAKTALKNKVVGER